MADIVCGQCQHSISDHTDEGCLNENSDHRICGCDETASLLMMADRDRYRDALNELQDAEAHYRLMHDTSQYPPEIGRAWDLMRRAGNRARKMLGLIDP
jgi:hypothetical protein